LLVTLKINGEDEMKEGMEGKVMVHINKGYESLHEVLVDALNQAQDGKGKERHAKDNEPFERQKICEITRRVGLGGPLFQVCKKTIEAQKLGGERGVAELLGAINYLAAAVIVMREG
jgi:hypothetical protein